MEAAVRLWLTLAHLNAQESAREKDPNKWWESIPWWDEHSLDQQHAFQTACLLAGSWPERFGQLPAAFGAPPDRIRKCALESRTAAAGRRKMRVPEQGVIV